MTSAVASQNVSCPTTTRPGAASATARLETIAVAIIARNEARHLERLLPTLTWADELVVLVDAATTDDTAAAARRHGARTATRPFDNFSAQRNAALAMCRADWVLSLDADERVTPSLAAELPAALRGTVCDAFRVLIRSQIFGRPFRFSGTQDDRPVRLFRRQGAAWIGAVHETLHVSGAVGRMQGTILHDTLADLPTFLRKMQEYTALEAATRVASGRGPWRGERWWAAGREFFRRLVWKHGWLDGPTGWAFCALSGLSAWVAADRVRKAWPRRQAAEVHHRDAPARDASCYSSARSPK